MPKWEGNNVPTTFSLADDDAHKAVARIMAAYHPLLRDAGVVVGVLFASNEDGPALAHKGARWPPPCRWWPSRTGC